MARRVLHLLRSQDTIWTRGRVAFYPNDQRTTAAGPVLKTRTQCSRARLKTPTLCAARLCAELYNANCKKKRPRVDSSKMPAQPYSLPQLKMPGCGVSIEPQSGVA